MKFIHTADWQLGRIFGFEGAGDGHDPAAALFEARFAAVERIAALAAQEQVDAVLVAGDVLDAQGISDHSLRRMVLAMQGFAGRWVLLPGNHDAALAESVWTRLQRLGIVGGNITLALTPGVHEFADAGFAVLAAPLTQRHTHDDVTAHFDTLTTAPGLIRIGLAHGSVQGILPEDIDSANPIAPDRAATAQLDYLALGDWHGLKQIDARTWYSGTPEAERFRNNEPGQVLLVEIDTPGALPRVTPHPIGRYPWQALQAQIDTASDIELWQQKLAAVQPQDVIRLQLTGTTDMDGYRVLQAALADARARAHVLEVDDTGLRLAPTEDDLARLQPEPTVAALIAELRLQQEDPEHSATTSEALRILFDLLHREGARA